MTAAQREGLLYLTISLWLRRAQPDQLQHPEWLFGLDTGRLSAYESRIRLMEMAVEERLLVHAFHEQFPGLGYIKRDGAFFDWEPMLASNIGNGIELTCSKEE